MVTVPKSCPVTILVRFEYNTVGITIESTDPVLSVSNLVTLLPLQCAPIHPLNTLEELG